MRKDVHGPRALLQTMRTPILIALAITIVGSMLFWVASDYWPQLKPFDHSIGGMIIAMSLLVVAPTAPTRRTRMITYGIVMVIFTISVLFAISLI